MIASFIMNLCLGFGPTLLLISIIFTICGLISKATPVEFRQVAQMALLGCIATAIGHIMYLFGVR